MNVLENLPENITRLHTERFRIILDDERLIQVLNDAGRAQKDIWNVSLSHLEKTYGYRHLDRRYPKSPSEKQYLVNELKAHYLALRYPEAKHWSFKITGIQSQTVNNFLMLLVTNFGEYRKTLWMTSKWDDKQKAEYKKKFKKAWYKRENSHISMTMVIAVL